MHADVPFVPWGTSHVVVVIVAVLGAAALVPLGRRAPAPVVGNTARALAVVLVLTTVAYQIYAFEPGRAGQTLPLWLSDLVPYVAAWALWSRAQWAYGMTYYWALTLTVQALATPALGGPDFPAPSFLAFFAAHVLPIWAAVLLTWGRGRRPGWADYRRTVVATLVWAVVAQVANQLSGANYGYLDRKPDAASVLDLFGPWPVYLFVEAAVVLLVWALITWPWTGSRRRVKVTSGG
ncbi:TIGR02206 family membrane protein [Actinomycetospora termitidis]|uniref:TIGR02206 family membrane protein n=1 Tax=Actinomycetospora termitidis TaxID=3053470 RepID=A0ABT7MBT9_9PSEU|nr:TIGR02206 family membrane protein [Actinomycetospora sp. Odt1-22]MDL5158131.1 TIGR02206 family membrane protein [Actinomycetospora sp. Odt1-22]